MQIKKFEDIETWQEARMLTKNIYRLTNRPTFRKDFGLTQQIQRASVSIMNNIAEGFDSSSKAEFIKFLSYSRRSTSEVQCSLYVALDQDYLNQNGFNDAYSQCEKVRKMITSFMKYLKNFNPKTR